MAYFQVEICRPFGDSSKPRSWSKYAKDSSAYQKIHPSSEEPAGALLFSEKEKKNSKGTKPSKLKNSVSVDDPKFREFLDIHGKKIENESGADFAKSEGTVDAEAKVELSDTINEILSEIAEEQAIVIRGLPQNVKQTSLKQFLAPVRPKSMKIIRDSSSAIPGATAAPGATAGAASAAVISFQKLADLRRIEKRNGEFFGGFKLEISSVGKSAKQSLQNSKIEKMDEKTIQAEERKIL